MRTPVKHSIHTKQRHGVTIGIAAGILGVSTTTLRHWDRTGVLRAQRDTHNGYRRYQIEALERFADHAGMRIPARQKAKLIL